MKKRKKLKQEKGETRAMERGESKKQQQKERKKGIR